MRSSKIKCESCKARFLLPEDALKDIQKEEIKTICPNCERVLIFSNPFTKAKVPPEPEEEKEVVEAPPGEEETPEEIPKEEAATASPEEPSPPEAEEEELSLKKEEIPLEETPEEEAETHGRPLRKISLVTLLIILPIIITISAFLYIRERGRVEGLYQDALKLTSTGDLQSAYMEMNDIIKDYPDDRLVPTIQAELNKLTGSIHSKAEQDIKDGNLTLAEEALTLILDPENPSPEVLISLLNLYYHQNNFDKAYPLIHKAVDLNMRPDHPVYFLILGMNYLDKGLNVEAINEFIKGRRMAIKKNASEVYAQLSYLLGKAYRATGKSYLALTAYEEYISRPPQTRKPWVDEDEMWGYIRGITYPITLSASYVNVREGPSISSTKLGRIHRGDEVKFLYARGEWARFIYKKNMIGYIYRPLLFTVIVDTDLPPVFEELFNREGLESFLSNITYKPQYRGVRFLFPIIIRLKWNRNRHLPRMFIRVEYSSEDIKKAFPEEYTADRHRISMNFTSLYTFLKGMVEMFLKPMSLRAIYDEGFSGFIFQEMSYELVLYAMGRGSLMLRGYFEGENFNIRNEFTLTDGERRIRGQFERKGKSIYLALDDKIKEKLSKAITSFYGIE